MDVRTFILFYFPFVIGALATVSATLYVHRLRRHVRLTGERDGQRAKLR